MSTPARMTVTAGGGVVWERTDETSVNATISLSREHMSTSSLRVGMIHQDRGSMPTARRTVWGRGFAPSRPSEARQLRATLGNGALSAGESPASTRTSAADDCIGFDLHQHLRRYQRAHLHHRRRRADVAEILSMRLADFFPLGDVDHEHSGAHDIFQRSARLQ